MKLPDLRLSKISGKKVMLRADLDVSVIQNVVGDDTRLRAVLPTLSYLLNNHASVYIVGHMGRPEGRIQKELSLLPVAGWFAKQIKSTVKSDTFNTFPGWRIAANVVLLENLRFQDGEEKNDSSFSFQLASLSDIYVNDAFAMCHRNHASIVGVAKLLPHYAGFHLEKEVHTLSTVIEQPKRPLVVIIGGEKIETKLPLVEKMALRADFVLVGGKIAQEKAQIQKATQGKKAQIIVAELTSSGEDITKDSVEQFIHLSANAGTIVWNGPMGLIRKGEEKKDNATKMLALGIAKQKGFKVVGGGNTIEFLRKINVLSHFDFVSTGGGAMLFFLSGEKLPGLEALS